MTTVYALPMLGFVSTFVRALVAALIVARYGVPASQETGRPVHQRQRAGAAMTVALLLIAIGVLLVLRVPVAFAFLGPGLAYMVADRSVDRPGDAADHQRHRQLHRCSPCLSSC